MPAEPLQPTPADPEASSAEERSAAEEHGEAFEGIDVDILEDGTVRLHAACRPGQDPSECAQRIRFLVDALGIPLESVVTEVTPAPPAEALGQDED